MLPDFDYPYTPEEARSHFAFSIFLEETTLEELKEKTIKILESEDSSPTQKQNAEAFVEFYKKLVELGAYTVPGEKERK